MFKIDVIPTPLTNENNFKCNNGLAACYLNNISAVPDEMEVLFPAGTTF